VIRPLRIGNASAAWGDTIHAARQLVERGRVDILTGDYLAEVTMAILARQRARDPGAGFVPDWLAAVGPVLPQIRAQGIRLITNAGGMNPAALAAAFAAEAARQGLAFRLAVVAGDDLLADWPAIRAAGVRAMDGGPLPERVASANAYLGARPIAAALDAGAEVVITGRVVDSALALGPLIHHFGWGADDWDRLAQGALAGHVIECGAQATGGLFTDWQAVAPGWADMGFPVVEVAADGSFTLEKPPGTGGLIHPGAVAEQILYEIGDPGAYRLPDVCCDFTGVTVAAEGERVRVRGARGRPPGGHYKVCATVPDGFRLITTLMIAGGDAGARGRAAAEALVARARRLMAAAGLADVREVSIEVIGAGDATGRPTPAPEAVVKIGVRHDDAAALEILARDFAHPGVAMAQGVTGALFGRPQPQPVLRVVSFPWPKDRVAVTVDGAAHPGAVATAEPDAAPPAPWPDPPPPGPRARVPLRALAWGRSGDKGDDANIGLIARDPALWPVLAAEATEALAARVFAHLRPRAVRRWALPGLRALNLVLEGVLGGGGSASLRYDPQGKTFAQILLDAEVEVPAALLAPGGPLDRAPPR
jgi:hypothetical protein